MIWRVKNSNCYPKEWKVYPTRKYTETNDPGNYFVNLGEAWREANRRNEVENDSIRTNEYTTIKVAQI